MTTKVNKQTKFTSLSKQHTRCGLTDVETYKRYEDFPINLPDWKFGNTNKDALYVYEMFYIVCSRFVFFPEFLKLNGHVNRFKHGLKKSRTAHTFFF